MSNRLASFQNMEGRDSGAGNLSEQLDLEKANQNEKFHAINFGICHCLDCVNFYWQCYRGIRTARAKPLRMPCSECLSQFTQREFDMKLHGTLFENLTAAVASAKRHNGRPVYTETLKFWTDLLQYARRQKAEGVEDGESLNDLLVQLDLAVSERRSLPKAP